MQNKRLTLNAEKRKAIENVFQSHWEREDSPVIKEWQDAKNTYDTMKPKVFEFRRSNKFFNSSLHQDIQIESSGSQTPVQETLVLLHHTDHLNKKEMKHLDPLIFPIDEFHD